MLKKVKNEQEYFKNTMESFTAAISYKMNEYP